MAKKPPAKKAPTPAPVPAAQPPPAPGTAPADLDALPLTITVEIGRTRQPIGAVLDLGEQSVVEFDQFVQDPVDIRLNGVLWARGEVVTVGDRFGVRVLEVLAQPGD